MSLSGLLYQTFDIAARLLFIIVSVLFQDALNSSSKDFILCPEEVDSHVIASESENLFNFIYFLIFRLVTYDLYQL